MPEEKPRSARGKRGRNKKAARSASEAAPVNPNAGRAMMVVNPLAGGGEVARIWDGMLATLRDLGLDFDFKFTEKPEHAIEISREAARGGYSTIVVVGGDGTFFEALNGVMSVERKMRPLLGIVPTGRANDFSRALGIPMDWLTACSFLLSSKKRSVDVGWMEYLSPDGVRTGYFAGAAGLGFEGEASELAGRMPDRLKKAVGGAGTRLLSMVGAYARYKEKEMEIVVDGKSYHVLATSCVIANCKYFANRMCIAPDADCGDGLFDVVVVGAGFGKPVLAGAEGVPSHSVVEKGVAKLKVAWNVPRYYRGTHTNDESVLVLRGAKVKVTSADRLVLQTDGELLGEGPFTAEILPGAVDIIA